jgi:hypothetical protein
MDGERNDDKTAPRLYSPPSPIVINGKASKKQITITITVPSGLETLTGWSTSALGLCLEYLR